MKTREALAYFPLAAAYAPGGAADARMMREASPRGRVFGYSERHVQAVWFDPRWRPQTLHSSRGEEIDVESPGTWNLEAGPDFLGAALRVGPDRRRITGDVEVHVFPAGWKQHGHRLDRRYRNVCLHLTFYEGHLPEEEFPPGTLQVALRPAIKTDPGFSFEHIDVTAYPYGGRADVPPCRRVMSTWPVEGRMRLLASAGQERLRLKAARLAGAMVEQGLDQVLYESVMVALGYQHNKQAFAELARLLPVDILRALTRGEPERAYALLAGMSGLLPGDVTSAWDRETQRYVRTLWDVWWKERAHLPPPMTRDSWRLSGIRPANHPLRRLAAAAHMFAVQKDGLTLLSEWVQGPPEELTARMSSSLRVPKKCYWLNRLSLGGPTVSSTALVGIERWHAMALNVVIPLAAAAGFDTSTVARLLDATKPEAGNQIVRQTAFYLYGPDAPSSLLKSAQRRQGLQQIFHDYCLGDRSRCARCAFPDLLKNLHSG